MPKNQEGGNLPSQENKEGRIIEGIKIGYIGDVPKETFDKFIQIEALDIKDYMEKAAQLDMYPTSMWRSGEGKITHIDMEYVEGGFSETNVLDFPMTTVGYAGYNREGVALINGHGDEENDHGGFSETGETVAVDIGEGKFTHYIVSRGNHWIEWFPRKREIEEYRRMKDKK